MARGAPSSSVQEAPGDGGSAPALTDAEFSAAVAAVTNAFGDPTRRDIYLFARDSGQGVTASGVAERFALHANVARHHLDKLAAGGYLEVHIDRPEGGGAGRPSKRYRASDKGMGLEFPTRRDDLLINLLGRALDGTEAAIWGLVHRSVPAPDLDAAAADVVGQLVAGPTVALGLTKWLLHAGATAPLEQHLRDEAFALELSSRSEDFREGLSAFKERRPPEFRGR